MNETVCACEVDAFTRFDLFAAVAFFTAAVFVVRSIWGNFHRKHHFGSDLFLLNRVLKRRQPLRLPFVAFKIKKNKLTRLLIGHNLKPSLI